MDRREVLSLLGAGAAGLAAVGGGSALAQREGGERESGKRARSEGGEHGEHIRTLGRTARLCARAAKHCLDELCEGEGDRKAHARSLEMAAGCEKFCTLMASLMACDNELACHMHEPCANACRDCCAAACEQFAESSGVMKECAEACRESERFCRRLANESKRSS